VCRKSWLADGGKRTDRDDDAAAPQSQWRHHSPFADAATAFIHIGAIELSGGGGRDLQLVMQSVDGGDVGGVVRVDQDAGRDEDPAGGELGLGE